MNSTLTLTQEWDKTFPQNAAVDHCKVTFHNRFGIELAADLYKPKSAPESFAAVAVSGPFGAVKEQCSGLYAQELAARGFLTVAFDPSYTGESGGTPRYVASPDINTEDFSAAVDFLSVRDDVDPERIGILGICGWGGMALNAAAIDTRIKATVTTTMYDMTRVTANGYFNTDDNPDARYALRQALNAQRTADYKAGTYQRAGGVIDPAAGRRSVFRQGLPRLLQDAARLPPALAQLHRRLERHVHAVAAQRKAARLRRGDPQRRAHDPWRQGTLVLLQPRRLHPAAGRQQGAAAHPRRRTHRSLRPNGHHPVRPHRSILSSVSEIRRHQHGQTDCGQRRPE
ncbi:MAG: alpha/beta hydrolase [Oscillospiraceae bacterium]